MSESVVALPIHDPVATLSCDALVTSADLAAWLGVAPRTLRKMISTGDIGPRPFRVAKGLRWRRESIAQWLIESEQQGQLINRRSWEIMQANRETETTPHRHRA